MSSPSAALEALVSAAMQAPSGDNMQPWRFSLDPREGTVSVHLDPGRHPSPMNAGQRMSRIACGAALENLVRAAWRRGWRVIQETPYAPRPTGRSGRLPLYAVCCAAEARAGQ